MVVNSGGRGFFQIYWYGMSCVDGCFLIIVVAFWELGADFIIISSVGISLGWLFYVVIGLVAVMAGWGMGVAITT